jgi:hypothetical protein
VTDLESRIAALLAQAGAVTPRPCWLGCSIDEHSEECNKRHAQAVLARQARMVAAIIDRADCNYAVLSMERALRDGVERL